MRPGAGQERATGKSVTVLLHSQPPGEKQQPSRATEEKHPVRQAAARGKGELWARTLLWFLWEGAGEAG